MNTYILYLKFESLVAPGKVGGEREHNRSRRGHVLEGGEVIPPFAAKDAISPVVRDLEAVEGARAAALSLPSDTALQFEGEKIEAQEAIASDGKNIRPSSGRLNERTDTRKWHRVSINRQKARAADLLSFSKLTLLLRANRLICCTRGGPDTRHFHQPRDWRSRPRHRGPQCTPASSHCSVRPLWLLKEQENTWSDPLEKALWGGGSAIYHKDDKEPIKYVYCEKIERPTRN